MQPYHLGSIHALRLGVRYCQLRCQTVIALHLHFSEGWTCKPFKLDKLVVLTICKHNAPTHLVMRTRPYRNDRIINVIRDMFFAGGATSFARRFQFLFPTFEGRNGDEKMEVPIAMVALVATAVTTFLDIW